MDIQVQILSDTLVVVSWERILNIPEITHYTVFYTRAGTDDPEEYMNIATTEGLVVIRNLNGSARSYQFVVVAVATVNFVEISGERSANPVTVPPPISDEGMDYGVSCNIIYYIILPDGCLVQMPAVEMHPLLLS